VKSGGLPSTDISRLPRQAMNAEVTRMSVRQPYQNIHRQR
jgi:hypothetical protein